MKKTCFALFLFLFTALVSLNAVETTAEYVYLVDAKTGEVLLEKNADALMVPSSMTKIMTAYLVFDRLKQGAITPDTTLTVSEKAWRMGGSKMFVQVGDAVKVDDLLKGVIVQSGNDACVVLAEGLAGDEVAFADEMTRVAHELGAKNATFLNATGWPDEGHMCTSKDLAIIAQKTLAAFPEEYKAYYPLADFTYNNIRQENRNPLLAQGADGMKTGHTDAGGYGVVATKVQGDRRLILVINGLGSAKERAAEASKVMSWGFAHFDNYTVAKAGDEVEKVDVWGGDQGQVSLVTDKDATITLPKSKQRDMQIKFTYDTPLQAPLMAGTEVGKISVSVDGQEKASFPLKIANDVQEAGFFKRIGNSIHYLLFGKSKA